MPALMLANTLDEKLDFLQPIETISADAIADMVGEHVFVDLLMTISANDTEGVLRAYERGAPEPKDKPANPDAFGGIFSEL